MSVSGSDLHRETGNEFWSDLKKIISIPSFNDELTDWPIATPLGPAVTAGLDFFENLAERDGFRHGNIDNRVVWIEYGDPTASAANTVAILGHVDVVPAEGKWHTNPFTAVLADDGEVFGRGTMDMKGDLLANYYALRYLQKHAVRLPSNTKVRLIIGGNEEGHWQDLPFYFAREGRPEIGYSPDGKFPVGQGEKGLLSFEIKTPMISQYGLTKLIDFHGGEAENMVPARAMAQIQSPYAQSLLRDFYDYLSRHDDFSGDGKLTNGVLTLTVRGRAAHGAYPYLGVNAITELAHFLTRIDFDPFIKAFLEVIGKYLNEDPYVKKLGLDYTHDVMGPLTENLGVLNFSDQGWESLLNFRLPLGAEPKRIIETFNQLFKQIGVQSDTITRLTLPHFVASDDAVVKTLGDIYTLHTGDQRQTFVANGGSYASLLKRGVSFGGQFPDVAVVSHQVDEHATYANYFAGMAIFIDAITALATLLSEEQHG